MRDLAEAQVAAGHKVGIVCDSSTGGAFEEELFRKLGPLLELGCWRTPMQRHIGPGDLAAAWRAYGIIQRLQPDILHGHGAKGGVYARVFGSLLRVSRSRVARLYSPHGGSLHYSERTLTGWVFFRLERLMEAVTDHTLFVSDYERRAFIRKVGVPRSPNSLVHNGLRAEEFVPVEPAADAADFLYVGMMRDLKGPDLFLDALAKVETHTGRRVSAVLVGDGDDLPRYMDQARALRLEDRVSFLPPMPARQAFRLGRVIVVPSRAEAMPYIVLEALAAGKSMVATHVGGIPEIFGSRSAALSEVSAGKLAGRMSRALVDPEGFRNQMPTLVELRRRFSATAMAASIETAYRISLGQKSILPAPGLPERSGSAAE